VSIDLLIVLIVSWYSHDAAQSPVRSLVVTTLAALVLGVPHRFDRDKATPDEILTGYLNWQRAA
jgi:hypothetical protein